MKVIVCLDDNGGMTFNHRRQSRDRVLCADVVKMAEGTRIFLSPYSAPLFAEAEADIVCDGNFLDIADGDSFCFVEDRALAPYADGIDEIVIYRWNRRYPFDVRFDLDPKGLGLALCHTSEFEGYSHEKITKEIYRK